MSKNKHEGPSLNSFLEEEGIAEELNAVIEAESLTRALTEVDMETHFCIRAARGENAKGLSILDALDRKNAGGKS
jgi:hypothetical protein